MLGDYIKDQPLISDILSKEIMNKKVSHAYLFDVSLYPNSLPFIYGFINSILCPKNKISNNNCNECNLCKMIKDNSFPDIVLIEPDGTFIKKEQLLLLQSEFVTTSLYNKKKIYIIKYAENLHQSAANSILKFLEEPESNIIAILMTKNISNVLTTIVSRCQVLTLLPVEKNYINYKEKIGHVIFDDHLSYEEFINSESSNDLIDAIVKFIEYYEKHRLNIMGHTKKYWFDYFSDKKNNMVGYNLMILYYKDVINYKLNREIEYFKEYISSIENTANNNELINIYNKINIIIDAVNYNKYNVNLALNLDNLIIRMEGL